MILMKKNKKFYLSIISITILFVFTCLIFHTKLIELTNKIITFVFYNGLSSNGRFELYNYAINRLFSNPKYALFGLGFVESYYSDFGNQSLAMKDIFLVYHSTIIQTLSIGGIIGLLVFIVFIYKRYIIMIKEFNNPLYKFLFIGLLPVEAYGLIDNTYHMFYFMIPLVISMGIFETHNVRKDKIMC